MTAIETILGSPLAQAIGWALVHVVWQGAILAGVLAALLALMQRQSAQARYAVSCAAMLLIVVLAAATGVRVYDKQAAKEAAVAAPAPAVASALDDSVTQQPSDSGTFLSATRATIPYIVFTWLLGVALLSARLAGGWMRAQRLAKRDSYDASPEWQRTVRRLSEALALRRGVQLLHSAAVEVPTVLGFLRPVILLPMTLSGLSPEQVEMILAHELAHIRRHDFLVNLMQTVVETLLFYHPAVWWISGCIRVEREHCCDDAAVAVCGNALQYARALTRLEELRAENPTQLAVAANGGSLLDRIRRVAGIRGEASAPARWAAGAALLSVIAVLLIVPSLPLFARNETPKAPAPPAAPKALDAVPAVPAAPAAPAAPKVTAMSGTHIDVTPDADDDDMDADIDMPEPPDPPDPPDPVEATTPRTPRAPRAPMAMPMHVTVPAIHVAPVAIPKIDIPAIDVKIDERQIERMEAEASRMAANACRDAFHVDKSYIEALRGAGLTASEPEAAQLHMLGVTPAYVRALRNAGLKKLTVHNVMQLRALNITPEIVRELKKMQ